VERMKNMGLDHTCDLQSHRRYRACDIRRIAPASAWWSYAEWRLSRTIVLFPNADYGLICNLLQGIHGRAIDDRLGQAPVKVWQYKRRGSTITATSVVARPRLLYQPANRAG
jgi:hypothetical protein